MKVFHSGGILVQLLNSAIKIFLSIIFSCLLSSHSNGSLYYVICLFVLFIDMLTDVVTNFTRESTLFERAVRNVNKSK